MPEHAEDLHAREKRFGADLDARYPGLWPVMDCTLHWAGQVFAASPAKPISELPESELAGRTLMARILTDIYAMATLAWRGYTVQMTSLAASTFESCFYLSYIGLNDDKAEKWLNHPDHTTSFVSVFAAIQGTMINDISDQVTPERLEEAVRDEYQIYQQLCAVKHGNAAVQMPLGVQWNHTCAEVHVGPQLTSEGQEVTLWVLWNVLRQVLSAADAYARAHVPQLDLARLKPRLVELDRQMVELSRALPTTS